MSDTTAGDEGALKELVDDVEDVVNICQVRVLQSMGKFVLGNGEDVQSLRMCDAASVVL